MKITINNKTTTIDLTPHNWTLEKQFEKFLGEWEEFQTAYKIDHSLTFDKYKLDVIQEGLDVVKSGQKCIQKLTSANFNDYNLDGYMSYPIINDYIDVLESGVNILSDNVKSYMEFRLVISNMLLFLKDFCIEHDEDLFEHIKINNDKTNGRGTDKKVYLDTDDIDFLWLLKSNLYDEQKDKLKAIIDRIEE